MHIVYAYCILYIVLGDHKATTPGSWPSLKCGEVWRRFSLLISKCARFSPWEQLQSRQLLDRSAVWDLECNRDRVRYQRHHTLHFQKLYWKVCLLTFQSVLIISAVQVSPGLGYIIYRYIKMLPHYTSPIQIRTNCSDRRTEHNLFSVPRGRRRPW